MSAHSVGDGEAGIRQRGDREAGIRQLAEVEAGIRQLHARYTDATFRQDADSFAQCFTPEGEWRISGRIFRGRDEIREGIEQILSNFIRVLITFRTPILDIAPEGVSARTYITEHCAWKNGNTNISIGRYYERFTQQDGRWYFNWRLFEIHYRGAPDLTGTFYDWPDYGPPPAMPPLDADTVDTASVRWNLPPA